MQLNAATLQHYWWMGSGILRKQEEHGWGAKVIDMLSSDLRHRYGEDSGYSITFVAEHNGMSTSTLTTAFKNGDIQLSTLYRILDCLGLWVSWNFVENNGNETN